MGNCLGEKVSSEKKSGCKNIRVRFCLSGKKSEWEIVAVRNCPVGFCPVGYCRVGNCLGENVSSEKMTVNQSEQSASAFSW